MKKNVKKVAIFSTIGLLSVSSISCSKNSQFEEINSRIENMTIDSTDSISLTLEDEFHISISDEASEYLDNSCVQDALDGHMDHGDYKELSDVSYMYFSQRLKEDNPEYARENLAVSYEEEPMISMNGNSYIPDAMVGEYLNDFYLLQQGMVSQDEQLPEYAFDVAKDMMRLAVVEVEVDSHREDNQVFVKEKKQFLILRRIQSRFISTFFFLFLKLYIIIITRRDEFNG